MLPKLRRVIEFFRSSKYTNKDMIVMLGFNFSEKSWAATKCWGKELTLQTTNRHFLLTCGVRLRFNKHAKVNQQIHGPTFHHRI